MTTDTTLNGKSPARHDIIIKAGKNTISTNTDCRVLYVEDNRFNQELAKMMFSRIGCVVEIAGNGYEALEKIVRERFHIIFMDINLPGLNGYETTIIIRKKLGLQIPILALTHGDSNDDARMCLQVGMNDHVKKPLNQKELTHSIMCWRKDKLVTINK